MERLGSEFQAGFQPEIKERLENKSIACVLPRLFLGTCPNRLTMHVVVGCGRQQDGHSVH